MDESRGGSRIVYPELLAALDGLTRRCIDSACCRALDGPACRCVFVHARSLAKPHPASILPRPPDPGGLR
jgi:hypothetical protein